MRALFLALFLTILFLFLEYAANAYEVGLKAGYDKSSGSYSSGGTSWNSHHDHNGFLIGVFASAPVLIDDLTIDGGIEYSKRGFEAYSPNTNGTQTGMQLDWHVVQLPVIARYWLIRYASIGTGLYYAFGVGKVDSNVTVGSTQSRGSVGFSDAHINSSDFGFILSAQGKLPISTEFNALAEIRWVKGLLNQADAADTSLKMTNWEFIGGVSLSL